MGFLAFPFCRTAIGIAAALASGVAAGGAFAQQPTLRVDRFTTEQGIASNTVQGLVQDRAGFIWVGTRYGIQRFDGRSFVPFSFLHPAAPPDVSAPISDLIPDQAGRIWALTPHAFVRFDPIGRKIERIPINAGIGAYAADSSGLLWFTERGTLKWVDADRRPLVVHVVGRFQHAQILAASRGGGIWVADRDSIFRFDPRTGKARAYAAAPPGLIALSEDGAGRLWLSSVDGLAVLDSATRGLRTVEPFNDPLATTRFTPDGHGGLMVATDFWLVQIDSIGQIGNRWSPPEVFGRGALPARLLVDREGAFWLGTTTAGLIRLATGQSAFRHFSSRSRPALPFESDFVMAVREQADGTVWVGTLRGGAYRITADWSRIDAFRHAAPNAGSLASNEVWDFEEDRHGNLWMLTSHNLCKVIGNSLRCLGLPEGARGDVARDGAGFFWLVSVENKLVSFDPETERFGASVPLPEGISSPITIFADRDSGYLWIGGVGVARARVAAGRVVTPPVIITRVSDNAPPINFHFFRDRNGQLWLGSHDGLKRWDASTASFETVGESGAHFATVFSIAEDRTGRLWLGTARGLLHYSPRTGSLRRYTEKDGIVSGELNRRAVVLRRNGELLFGGVNGLTQFDPAVIIGSRDSVPVFFARWRRFTSQGAVDEAIHGDQPIRLSPADRAFTIEFNALTYAPDTGRRFRYLLEGLSSDWIETTEPVATFQKPRPGRYALRVQTAGGAEGAWSEPGAVMQLDVIPPLWATTWFRAAFVFLIVGLVWSAHRLRLRQAVAAEQLRLRISRDLHDDIGAGLSSIALISDVVGSAATVREQERMQLRRIGKVARGLVADLRDIIWAIDPDRDRLTDVVTRMKDVAASLLPGVRHTFVVPPDHELNARVGMSSRRDLLLLYKEILHNVARHAQADAVHIELVAHAHELTLSVSDNGRGFTLGSGRNGGGTGLKSLKERAVRLGGQLELQSRPGGGTTVRLTLNRRERVMRGRFARRTV